MTTQKRNTERDVNPYSKFSRMLKEFSVTQVLEIEAMCSMTFDEICAYFLIIPEDVSPAERKIVDMAINRGKAKGIKRATDKLFTNMSDGKQGVQACLSYLKRFSTEFNKEVDDNEGASGGTSYNINITVPNEPAEPHVSGKHSKEKLIAIK